MHQGRVCGKDPEVSSLQDLLIYSMKGFRSLLLRRRARRRGPGGNLFLTKGLFSTLTNVDFDPKRFETLIQKSVELREGLKAKVKAAGGRTDFHHGSASLNRRRP